MPTLSTNPAMAMEQVSQQSLVQKKIAMDSLRSRLGDTRTKDEQLREACEGFESVFIQKMWEQMRKTVPKEGYLHSKDEETYQSMFDVELSKKMAASGGIGLADMMYQQLSQQVTDTARATSVKHPVPQQENTPKEQKLETQGKEKLIPLISPDKLTADALYSPFSQDEFAYNEQAESPFIAPMAPVDVFVQGQPQKTEQGLQQEVQQGIQQEAQQVTPQLQSAPVQHLAELYPEYAGESKNLAAALAEIRTQTDLTAQQEGVNPVLGGTNLGVEQLATQNLIPQNMSAQNVTGQEAVATTATITSDVPQTFGMTAEQVYQMMAAQAHALDQNISTQTPAAQGTFFEQKNTHTSPLINTNPAVSHLSVAPGEVDAKPLEIDNVQKKVTTKIPGKGMLPASASWPHHGQIFSHFGWQNNPEAGMKREWNAGIGIVAKPDDQIIPCLPGTVAYIGEREQFGSTVVLEHAGGFTSYYGNVTPINLKVGDTVKSGTSFAKISVNPSFRQVGEKNAPLFFELKRGEMSLNPEAALNSTRTAGL